jgi:hypothetical protein
MRIMGFYEFVGCSNAVIFVLEVVYWLVVMAGNFERRRRGGGHTI